MNKQKGSVALIAIVVIVILAAIGMGYWYTQQKPSPIDSSAVQPVPEVTTRTGTYQDENTNIKITTDVTTVTSCGDMNCFEQKFAKCEPAKATASIFQSVTYAYEIVGSKGNLCTVKSKFTANPNPEWVGKEMICEYDNKKGFEAAAQEVVNSFNGANKLGNCRGELFNLMTGGL